MKRKEKPTGRWHVRNTHLRKQVVLSRIFKRIVPVDYSYQSKKKYQEPKLSSSFFSSFFPPKINGSNSKLSQLWLHNLEKIEKNYEDINTNVSFSVPRCFRSTGYLLLIIAHQRMYLLSICTKEGGTQNKIHVPSRVLLLCTYS